MSKTNEIRIKTENCDALEAALRTVQRGRRGQNGYDVDDILTAAVHAERALDVIGLRRGLRSGVRYTQCESGASSSSYRYAISSTVLELQRDRLGWKLTSVARTGQHPKARALYDVHLSEQQAMSLEDDDLRGYRRVDCRYLRSPRRIIGSKVQRVVVEASEAAPAVIEMPLAA